MESGAWRDAGSHEIRVFMCPSPAPQTCSFLGGLFLLLPLSSLMGAEPITAERSQDPPALPCLALPCPALLSSRRDQPPPSQQGFGSESGLLSLWMKTWPRPERETNVEDTFEEFQGIAESRPGAEGRGGLGIHWGTQAGNLCGTWMDAAPPGTILQGDLWLFMCLEERKCQELLK